MLVLVYQRVVPLLVFSNPMRTVKAPCRGQTKASVLFDGLEPQSHSEIPAVALDASSVLVVHEILLKNIWILQPAQIAREKIQCLSQKGYTLKWQLSSNKS